MRGYFVIDSKDSVFALVVVNKNGKFLKMATTNEFWAMKGLDGLTKILQGSDKTFKVNENAFEHATPDQFLWALGHFCETYSLTKELTGEDFGMSRKI
jgi:hypothetical protein